MAVPSAPTHIGNYSIVEQIGTGASSDVFLALEEKKFVTVALKQLRKTCQSEPYRKLMANEVALVGKLQHQNIVRLLSAHLDDKSGPYVVMEYVKGVPLDRHQHGDTLLPVQTVISVVEQIAKALQYIATQGVVHRDVKPENIILMPDGRAKLTDFGCAISTGTAGEMVAGSLAYMSPEQLEGEPLDERADIYSLGAVLYRLLCGRHTFEADSEFDARIAILNFPITPIGKYRQGLPPALVAVIDRALKKNRDSRYVNWDEFIRELGNAAHEIRMSDYDVDLYRGFSMSTQSVLSRFMSTDRTFSRSVYSRSGFSRSSMPDSFGG
ncbi:MAG TPA: serine/threonine-protein kinase [Gallionella sp.]|nr:serine/threonine-protein kinase [Gallionella sp.]